MGRWTSSSKLTQSLFDFCNSVDSIHSYYCCCVTPLIFSSVGSAVGYYARSQLGRNEVECFSRAAAAILQLRCARDAQVRRALPLPKEKMSSATWLIASNIYWDILRQVYGEQFPFSTRQPNDRPGGHRMDIVFQYSVFRGSVWCQLIHFVIGKNGRTKV